MNFEIPVSFSQDEERGERSCKPSSSLLLLPSSLPKQLPPSFTSLKGGSIPLQHCREQTLRHHSPSLLISPRLDGLRPESARRRAHSSLLLLFLLINTRPRRSFLFQIQSVHRFCDIFFCSSLSCVGESSRLRALPQRRVARDASPSRFVRICDSFSILSTRFWGSIAVIYA